MTVVFVDAENVRRSRWPNLTPEELVERCRSWAETADAHAVVVFDGRAPDTDENDHIEVVGTGTESADDWIARAASKAEGYWLVTSDRELRERAGGRAECVIGGGSFLAELA